MADELKPNMLQMAVNTCDAFATKNNKIIKYCDWELNITNSKPVELILTITSYINLLCYYLANFQYQILGLKT